MKVAELLESRRQMWRELEEMCGAGRSAGPRAKDACSVTRFSALYRAACADLALAEAHQFPPSTVRYLHRLVGRAHNRLYRSQSFTFSTWIQQLLVNVPQRLFNDIFLRVTFCVFWGVFLLSAYMAYNTPGFAEQVAGKEMIQYAEESFSEPPWELSIEGRVDTVAAYILHNGSIGLRCFAFGLIFAVGGLYITVYNASALGALFGHMATVSQWDNFSEFVTAHAPFELTAIVLSAAAGMRMGFSLVDTQGLRRIDSLRRGGQEAMPVMCAAIIMFLLAAIIEGLLSPSASPYWAKAGVAVLSTGLLMFYFVGLGYPRGE